MTIHSWGAVTPGMTNIERQISCIKTCKPAFQRWKATKVLIIDEGEFPSFRACCATPNMHYSIHGRRRAI